jgi:hypothetical protein
MIILRAELYEHFINYSWGGMCMNQYISNLYSKAKSYGSSIIFGLTSLLQALYKFIHVQSG